MILQISLKCSFTTTFTTSYNISQHDSVLLYSIIASPSAWNWSVVTMVFDKEGSYIMLYLPTVLLRIRITVFSQSGVMGLMVMMPILINLVGLVQCT
jgi:hypothetical protein